MAQPATNAKIEELRFRLKTDPKSRLFYPLAEELRKAGQVDEAEQVLRTGLVNHSSYLSAWVSLGRVLRDQKKDAEAVDVLTKALQLDPGNVVAARHLADAYLSLGDKVEAIKKYKLVHALLPSDVDLEEKIASLDREINPPAELPPLPSEEQTSEEPTVVSALPETVETESPFDRTMPPFDQAARVLGEEVRAEEVTGDAEPMHLAHEESPFEEPLSDYSAAAMTVEAPVGMHIDPAPLAAEVPTDVAPPADEAAVFEPTEDVTNTLTMADLYARQGLTEEARHIYENILARDPGNGEVRAKLDALDSEGQRASRPLMAAETAAVQDTDQKIARLESWLSKVSRKEVPGV